MSAVTAGANTAPFAYPTNNKRRRDPRRPAWETPPTRTGQGIKAGVLALYMALILGPLYIVAITSISTQGMINKAGGLVVVPGGITFNAYRLIFSGGVVARAAVISVAITAVGTAFSMVVTVLAAYGLSRSGSFGHRVILAVMMFTMFFSGGLIPFFLVVSDLGGYNQYWSLIVPTALSVFNILIMRQFFSTAAVELIESARIDGAGEWRILTRIMLPMSKATMAVIALFYAVGYWDSWFNVLLFMPAESQRWPLSYVLYQYVTLGQSFAGSGINSGQYFGHQPLAPLSLQMAIVMIVVLPILIIMPFVSKYFSKGVLLGAIKG
ncbi:MAG: carbohydrate ABC transporter permease [Actinomycetota bacterium]|jgi:putative aldouronate transport system permease protein|nr:carbohydrate ABC transporter permease [Actinomycetota bacterium]